MRSSVLVGALFLGRLAFAQPALIPLTMTFQQDAPVGLLGSRMANGDLFDAVTVVNISGKMVVRVQFAWVVLS